MELIEEVQEQESRINEKLKDNNILVTILRSEEKNKGKIIVLKGKQVIRNFEIRTISCCQIDIIENGKIIERGFFIKYLSEWIYNLYNPIEYLYVFYGGELNGKTLKREDVDKIAYKLTIDYHKEREEGLAVHRKELDNQPMVKEYLGPMYEKIDYGKIYLRYETQEIYDMLST